MISKPPRAMVRLELARGGDVRFEVAPLAATLGEGGGGGGGGGGRGKKKKNGARRR